MSADSNEFEKLRRLLALKRHEVPPPGYFPRFSGRVIARIQAEPSPGQWLDQILARFGLALTFRPAAVCAFGLVMTGLLASGVITTHRRSASAPPPWATSMAAVGMPAIRASMATPASTAPVLGQSSPFSHLVGRGPEAQFNVFVGQAD